MALVRKGKLIFVTFTADHSEIRIFALKCTKLIFVLLVVILLALWSGLQLSDGIVTVLKTFRLVFEYFVSHTQKNLKALEKRTRRSLIFFGEEKHNWK